MRRTEMPRWRVSSVMDATRSRGGVVSFRGAPLGASPESIATELNLAKTRSYQSCHRTAGCGYGSRARDFVAPRDDRLRPGYGQDTLAHSSRHLLRAVHPAARDVQKHVLQR